MIPSCGRLDATALATALESFWDTKWRDMVVRFGHTVTHVLAVLGLAGLYSGSRAPPWHGGRVSGLQVQGSILVGGRTKLISDCAFVCTDFHPHNTLSQHHIALSSGISALK